MRFEVAFWGVVFGRSTKLGWVRFSWRSINSSVISFRLTKQTTKEWSSFDLVEIVNNILSLVLMLRLGLRILKYKLNDLE